MAWTRRFLAAACVAISLTGATQACDVCRAILRPPETKTPDYVRVRIIGTLQCTYPEIRLLQDKADFPHDLVDELRPQPLPPFLEVWSIQAGDKSWTLTFEDESVKKLANDLAGKKVLLVGELKGDVIVVTGLDLAPLR